VTKGRLQPGRMFLVDTAQGRIIEDEEIKREICNAQPYGEWLNEHLVTSATSPRRPRSNLPTTRRCSSARSPSATPRGRAHHPHSDGPRRRRSHRLHGQRRRPRRALQQAAPLYDYFKQLFAQVTNPPIDCDPRGNRHLRRDAPRFRGQPAQPAADRLPPRRVEVAHPHQRGVRQDPPHPSARPQDGVLPILFRVTRGEKGLAKSMEELSIMARRMIEEEEANVLILSDRGVTHEFAPIPRSSPSPACTTISSARACARASASCSRPARRAKCTTSRC
jgi:hypothetical protein